MTAWTPGSPLSRPMTSPTCTPSPGGSNKTTSPCSTALPCRTAPARSRATSTGSKMIKRQMYGRASFDLLRKRVILAAGEGGRIDHEMWVRTSIHVPPTRGTVRSHQSRADHTKCADAPGVADRVDSWCSGFPVVVNLGRSRTPPMFDNKVCRLATYCPDAVERGHCGRFCCLARPIKLI